jgi:hypothetical protein
MITTSGVAPSVTMVLDAVGALCRQHVVHAPSAAQHVRENRESAAIPAIEIRILRLSLRRRLSASYRSARKPYRLERYALPTDS